MRFLFFVLAILSIDSCHTSTIRDSIVFADNPVIAHRGAWKDKNLPQNSIASLKHAIELGCTGSEFDVRMTKDHVLVVTHDPHYNGVLVETSTYAELSKFKLSNGELLPKLEDYLKAGMEKNPATGLVVEIKPSKTSGYNEQVTKKVMEMVKTLNAEKYIHFYISFSYDILKQIKSIDPNASVQYLDGSKAPKVLADDKIDGMDYLINVFKRHPQWIEGAKEKKLLLNAWTVDKEKDMDWLLDVNFDYITTNQPELLLKKTSEPSKKEVAWKLVWSDEFEGHGRIDTTKWSYEQGMKRNQEMQYYTDSLKNVRVENGMLVIEAHQSKVKNDLFVSKDAKGWKKNTEYANYTSGSLTTKGHAEWTYGRIEIRAKLPKGIGVWPAFWMIGENYDAVGWPECGEIDIMEYVGFAPDSIFGTIHTKAYNHLKGTQKGKKIKIDNPSDSFHTFVLEWTPETMDFILDNTIYNHIQNEHKSTAEWPFDQNFHLKINLAIGGMLGGRKGVDDSIFPQQLVVDYVRVYQKNDK